LHFGDDGTGQRVADYALGAFGGDRLYGFLFIAAGAEVI
jgi:hypothetical protein